MMTSEYGGDARGKEAARRERERGSSAIYKK
jgi:hypothetical protein